MFSKDVAMDEKMARMELGMVYRNPLKATELSPYPGRQAQECPAVYDHKQCR